MDFLEQETFFRLTGDDSRPRFASLEGTRGGAQIEFGLMALVAVAAEAFRLEERENV